MARLVNGQWDMLDTAQQIDQCCGLGRGINLLDNWWFGEGVINQRKITPGTLLGSQYGIDRWIGGVNNSWELRPGGGLVVHSAERGLVSINQRFSMSAFDTGRSLCISVLYSEEPESPRKLLSASGVGSSNLISARDDGFYVAFTFNNPTHETCSFRIASIPRSNNPIVWAAKLEYGTEQTLAHQDLSGNWVLNDPPPDPMTELLKCQRYQIQFVSSEQSTGSVMIGVGTANGVGSTCELFIPFPVPTSRRGVISYTGNWKLFNGKGNWGDGIPVVRISTIRNSVNGYAVSVIPESTLEAEKTYYLIGYPTNPSNPPDQFSFLFDANL